MEFSKPTYILFAGVNGVGKSTLYKMHAQYQSIPRINVDELVRSYGDWKDMSLQIRAGRQAVELIKEHFDNRLSFTQETTLCGKSIFKNIEKAKQLGYSIEIHYIGVDSVEICKERIRNRVQHGGHGISDNDVERRYRESFHNINTILPFCDYVYFYDNTHNFTFIADSQKGTLTIRTIHVPRWFSQNILDRE